MLSSHVKLPSLVSPDSLHLCLSGPFGSSTCLSFAGLCPCRVGYFKHQLRHFSFSLGGSCFWNLPLFIFGVEISTNFGFRPSSFTDPGKEKCLVCWFFQDNLGKKGVLEVICWCFYTFCIMFCKAPVCVWGSKLNRYPVNNVFFKHLSALCQESSSSIDGLRQNTSEKKSIILCTKKEPFCDLTVQAFILFRNHSCPL